MFIVNDHMKRTQRLIVTGLMKYKDNIVMYINYV